MMTIGSYFPEAPEKKEEWEKAGIVTSKIPGVSIV
jgi:hypothetical protein